jgi:hypothetical protein
MESGIYEVAPEDSTEDFFLGPGSKSNFGGSPM